MYITGIIYTRYIIPSILKQVVLQLRNFFLPFLCNQYISSIVKQVVLQLRNFFYLFLCNQYIPSIVKQVVLQVYYRLAIFFTFFM